MGGRDVDEILSMPSEKFDELEAMDRIIPFGDEKLGWVMANGFAAMCQRLDIILQRWCEVKEPPNVKPRNFIQWAKKRKRKVQEYVNPNAAAAAFKLSMNRLGG